MALGGIKTGGRTKGTRNKKLPSVEQALLQAKKDPIAEILKLLPDLDKKDQAMVWVSLLNYAYPKLKPFEVKEGEEAPANSSAQREAAGLLKVIDADTRTGTEG